MKITLVQANLHWEDASANLAHFDQLLAPLAPKESDLIILPEMFTTGFSMSPQKLAEPMMGPAMQWMQQKAQALEAVLAGSLIIEEGGKYYNRFVWMPPSGDYLCYDKKHLFTMAQEELHYEAGQEKIIIAYKGWRICPFVCYDLRFPIWNRNRQEERYDLAIYVANWPDKRSAHWRALLQARAIENQAYVAAVNRVGVDGTDLYYSGYSSLIAADGKILFQLKDKEQIKNIKISIDELLAIRKGLPFLKDQAK
ncbi:amidohydrolase [Saprospira grandis]|uniref:Omega-amidase YafV n=1 Tax=Saprospira grandis (strain Lewin) TaxID=984262 RepID=H6L0T7_SAPGL|nr:amidohydrolase [Saprospira grandis]AFC25893.1 putative NAD(P)-binding amidase-type enzyme with nitrilase/N-carbamoyl-D-aminoacid amidohydrolase [Saprospira grandis str. Lewin]